MSPSAARAHDPLNGLGPAIVEALNEMTFYSQAQLGLTGALADWERPGGMSLRASMSFFGIGAAGSLRFEPDGSSTSGSLGLGGQLRPLGLAQTKLYRDIDPFVSLGGEIGGGDDGLRAAGYVGAGCDVALFPAEEFHPVFVLEYQVRPLRTSPDMPAQLLHVGAAMRSVF